MTQLRRSSWSSQPFLLPFVSAASLHLIMSASDDPLASPITPAAAAEAVAIAPPTSAAEPDGAGSAAGAAEADGAGTAADSSEAGASAADLLQDDQLTPIADDFAMSDGEQQPAQEVSAVQADLEQEQQQQQQDAHPQQPTEQAEGSQQQADLQQAANEQEEDQLAEKAVQPQTHLQTEEKPAGQAAHTQQAEHNDALPAATSPSRQRRPPAPQGGLGEHVILRLSIPISEVDAMSQSPAAAQQAQQAQLKRPALEPAEHKQQMKPLTAAAAATIAQPSPSSSTPSSDHMKMSPPPPLVMVPATSAAAAATPTAAEPRQLKVNRTSARELLIYMRALSDHIVRAGPGYDALFAGSLASDWVDDKYMYTFPISLVWAYDKAEAEARSGDQTLASWQKEMPLLPMWTFGVAGNGDCMLQSMLLADNKLPATDAQYAAEVKLLAALKQDILTVLRANRTPSLAELLEDARSATYKALRNYRAQSVTCQHCCLPAIRFDAFGASMLIAFVACMFCCAVCCRTRMGKCR